MTWFLAYIAFAIAIVIGRHYFKRAEQRVQSRLEDGRRQAILAKYAGDPYAEDIARGLIRPGMTVQQLRDAWGPPAAVEERVLKTKVVHTYKYAQTSTRSFRQRVKVENGIVVGWTNS